MNKTFVKGLFACTLAIASFTCICSCVNEQYEISEDRLDLNVTLFQEGICLPLGSTERIRLDSIVNRLGLEEDFQKYLSAQNGAYSFVYKSEEPFDMSDQLGAINGLVNVNAIDFSKNIDFNLSQMDIDGISYDGDSFEVGADLYDMFKDFSIPELQIPAENFDIPADLYSYADDFNDINFDLGLAPGGAQYGEGRITIASIPSEVSIPDYFTDYTELSLEWWASNLSESIGIITKPHDAVVPINYEFRFPKEVKSVKDLHVAEGAKIRLSAQIENPFFTSGAIEPHVEIDLNQVFHLKDEDGKTHDSIIDDDFVLSSESGWKYVDEFEVEGLVLSEEDFVTDSEGYLWLRKSIELSVVSSLTEMDLKTSTNTLQNWLATHQTDRNVYLKVAVEFVDMHIDDATVELNPILIDRVETFDIDVPEISLPQQIKTADEVVFTENSRIDVTLTASGLSELGGLDFIVDDMEVTFPDKLIVEGAGPGNKVILEGGSIKEGITRQVRLKGINLGEPDQNGVIPAYNGEVSVAVRGNVAGEVHTGMLPASKEKDVNLHGCVETSVEIKDYAVTVAGYVLDSEKDPDLFEKQQIRVPVPQEMVSIKGMKVKFDNDPAIAITIDMPKIGTPIRPQDERGLVVKFPKMLEFKDGDYQKWFDPARHALVFSQSEDLPDEIVLPIDCLVVDPVKDETDGKYYVEGAVEVEGSIGIAEGARITKADVDELSKPGTKVKFVATVPKLVPSSADMDSYSMDLKESFDFDLLKDVNLPEMIVKVGQILFDEVYMSLAVTTGKDFPDLGENASLSMGLDVELPEFIEVDDERYKDGKLSVVGQLTGAKDGKGMEIVIEPVKLKALNLNMTRDELKKLKAGVSLDGNVSLSGASLVLDEWMNKSHTLDVVAGLMTIRDGVATDKLDISKITCNVDYRLEPYSINVDLSPLSEILNGPNIDAVIDIETFYAALGITTNLGVPIMADLLLTPYYGTTPGITKKEPIVLEPAESEFKTTTLWVSDNKPGDGQAVDQFVDIDLMSLLYQDEAKTQMADSIKVELDVVTDVNKLSVYDPEEEYKLYVDCEAGVPVAFGEHFEIVYRDTLDLPEEAAMLMKYGALALRGEVESSIPVGIEMSARLMDSNHNELKTSDKPISMSIPSADASGNPLKADVDLMVSNDRKLDVSDLKSIELTFRVDSKSAPGVQFREDNFISAVLYALIPNGITLDAAELIQEDQEEDDINE